MLPSMSEKGYIMITAYLIADWQLHYKVLAIWALEESSENLTEAVHKIKEFNIREFSAITTGNTAKMISEAQKVDIPGIPCFRCTLQ